MQEKLRNQIQELEADCEELEADCEELEELIRVKKSKKSTAIARMQARIFLQRIFAPYMDGVCKVWGVSPEEGLRILIDEKATFGAIAEDNPEALAELMNQQPIKTIINIANPLKDVSDDWIKEKMDVLFDVTVELRPELAKIIVETPGGREWFQDSLTSLRDIFFGAPKLSHLTD